MNAMKVIVFALEYGNRKKLFFSWSI